MIIGSLIVVTCLIVLGWTKEIVGIFIGDEDMAKTCSIAVAVLSIYALDFAINAGEQAITRSTSGRCRWASADITF
jgi:solute carrier family 45 protein 1/2/4